MRYEKGQKYGAHRDFFNPNDYHRHFRALLRWAPEPPPTLPLLRPIGSRPCSARWSTALATGSPPSFGASGRAPGAVEKRRLSSPPLVSCAQVLAVGGRGGGDILPARAQRGGEGVQPVERRPRGAAQLRPRKHARTLRTHYARTSHALRTHFARPSPAPRLPLSSPAPRLPLSPLCPSPLLPLALD